jgi:hypothetical protein
VPDVICRGLYIYFKMIVRFIDTGGIVDDHRLYKLSLHNVHLLEMLFCHGYCLFVLYPHPSDLSMSVGNNIIDAFRDLIISIGHNIITYLSIKYYVDYLI